MKLEYRFLDPEAILDSPDFRIVDAFLRQTRRRNIGWHYAVDLTWIFSRARRWSPGLRVLDAGGGRGPAQFLLAEMGFDVVNVDLMHTIPEYTCVHRYGMQRSGLASYAATPYLEHIGSFGSGLKLLRQARNAARESKLLRARFAASYARRHERWRAAHGYATGPVGHIDWLAGNLAAVPELDTGSFDAVVSLSSFEHIPPELLPAAIGEVRRLVRANGHWAVTTSGTERTASWYHAPSQGHCFSAADLSRVFVATPANDDLPGEILRKYQSSTWLKQNLALNYRLSGRNGMPWGRWNPAYIPVAIGDARA